jgi:hypothetical protein
MLTGQDFPLVDEALMASCSLGKDNISKAPPPARGGRHPARMLEGRGSTTLEFQASPARCARRPPRSGEVRALVAHQAHHFLTR